MATDKLDSGTAVRVQEALLAIRTLDDVKKLLRPIKADMVGLAPVADADYDGLRTIMAAVREDERRTGNSKGKNP